MQTQNEFILEHMDPTRKRISLLWTIGLTIGSIAPSIITAIVVATSFAEVSWLILPLVLRGAVIASWVVALITIATAAAVLRVKNSMTLRIVLIVLLFVSIVSAIIVLAAGIDITRMFTSPVTLAGKFGEAGSRIFSHSRFAPKGIKSAEGESLLTSAVHLSSGIIVLQLIGYLPYPYNVILFFMYYKFLTAIAFCVIPFAVGIGACFVVYNLWNETRGDDAPISDSTNERVSICSSNANEELEPLVVVHKRIERPHEGTAYRHTPTYPTLFQSP